jgi:hypothetical protein
MDTDLLPPVSRFSPGWVDFFIFLGAIILVAALIFYWAFAIRKRKNRIRKYRHHHHHRPGYREQLKKVADEIRQRRSGRRHEHRRINPTLAETGGLPPLREADKPPPPPPPQP